MIKVSANLVGLCIGIFIYHFIGDGDYSAAFQNSYFAVFGGLFIHFNRDKG